MDRAICATGPSWELLQAQALIHLDDAEGMAVDLRALQDAPTQANLKVKRVDAVEDFGKWIQALAKVFEFPDESIAPLTATLGKLGVDENGKWHHYIGMLDGKIVGTSSMFLGSGVAGVYNVATLPEARRRGLGTALTLVPLRDARERGYCISILHASEMGLGIYRRLGFKEYCKISHYVYLPSWVQRAVLRVYSWVQRYKTVFSRKRG